MFRLLLICLLSPAIYGVESEESDEKQIQRTEQTSQDKVYKLIDQNHFKNSTPEFDESNVWYGIVDMLNKVYQKAGRLTIKQLNDKYNRQKLKKNSKKKFNIRNDSLRRLLQDFQNPPSEYAEIVFDDKKRKDLSIALEKMRDILIDLNEDVDNTVNNRVSNRKKRNVDALDFFANDTVTSIAPDDSKFNRAETNQEDNEAKSIRIKPEIVPIVHENHIVNEIPDILLNFQQLQEKTITSNPEIKPIVQENHIANKISETHLNDQQPEGKTITSNPEIVQIAQENHNNDKIPEIHLNYQQPEVKTITNQIVPNTIQENNSQAKVDLNNNVRDTDEETTQKRSEIAPENKVSHETTDTRRNYQQQGLKGHLLSIMPKTFTDIENKIEAVKKYKNLYASDDKYQIGYIMANLDTLHLNMRTIERDVTENQHLWGDNKVLDLFVKLNNINDVAASLKNKLNEYDISALKSSSSTNDLNRYKYSISKFK